MREDQLQPRDSLDEIGNVVVRRVGHDFLGRSDLNHLTVLHDGDARSHANRFVQVVGNEQGGLAHRAGEFQELVLQPPANERVQRRERLVHQEDLGVRREGAGQADALLHPTRQFPGHTVAIALQVNRLDDPVGDLMTGIGVGVPQLEGERDVVAYAAMRQQRHVLEHHADTVGAQRA